MRACLLLLFAAAVAAAAGEAGRLPLPSPDGKPVATAPGQRAFRVPFRFARVEAFYRDRFRGDASHTVRVETSNGQRRLILKSTRAQDAWAKAVVREGEMETVIEVTPVLRAQAEAVQGNGKPLVELVLSRSSEVTRELESIDHAQP